MLPNGIQYSIHGAPRPVCKPTNPCMMTGMTKAHWCGVPRTQNARRSTLGSCRPSSKALTSRVRSPQLTCYRCTACVHMSGHASTSYNRRAE